MLWSEAHILLSALIRKLYREATQCQNLYHLPVELSFICKLFDDQLPSILQNDQQLALSISTNTVFKITEAQP